MGQPNLCSAALGIRGQRQASLNIFPAKVGALRKNRLHGVVRAAHVSAVLNYGSVPWLINIQDEKPRIL